jgi:hypothetical protein
MVAYNIRIVAISGKYRNSHHRDQFPKTDPGYWAIRMLTLTSDRGGENAMQRFVAIAQW